jgi:murein DD-endopeptidase MepM/ murein hydrolase activator NlpD
VLSGRVTSSYGWRRDPLDGSLRLHKGTDIAMPVGQEVPAARAGRVGFAGELPGYGLTVVVNHDGGRATRYAHLSELTVGAGDAVVEGQVIARSGATGRATGPHLHFELLEDGKPVDPVGRLGLLGAAIQISD